MVSSAKGFSPQWVHGHDELMLSLDVPLLEINAQGRITKVNAPAELLLGAAAEAWVNQVWTDAFVSVAHDQTMTLPTASAPLTYDVRTRLGDGKHILRLRTVRKRSGYLVRVQNVRDGSEPDATVPVLRAEIARLTDWIVQLSNGGFSTYPVLAGLQEHGVPEFDIIEPLADAMRKYHEALINPMQVVAQELASMARGEIPRTADVVFVGDFEVLHRNLDQCVQGLSAMQAAAHVIESLAVYDTADSVTLQLPGLFGDVVEAVNAMRSRVLGLTVLAQHVAVGDWSDLAKLEALGRLSDNDQVTPALIQLSRAMDQMVCESLEMERSAQAGDLEHRADETNLGGCFREVVRAMNATLDVVLNPVRTAMDVLTSLAEHDLRARMCGDFAGEFGKLQSIVNKMADELCTYMRGIARCGRNLEENTSSLLSATDIMSTVAEATATRAQLVASAIEDVDSHVQKVAAGIREMSCSITEIARNSASATGVAQQGVIMADGANSIVADLSSSSKQINKVLRVIVEIAQQTKLLSLNATIEAANAGDAGRGFAVVASEIKELAKETARATDDISQRVSAMQSSTERAIGSIESISAVIHHIEANQSAIAAAVEEQTATSSGMVERLADTARRSGEIAASIGSLDCAMAQTMKLIRESHNANMELRDVADQLTRFVAEFRMHE